MRFFVWLLLLCEVECRLDNYPLDDDDDGTARTRQTSNIDTFRWWSHVKTETTSFSQWKMDFFLSVVWWHLRRAYEFSIHVCVVDVQRQRWRRKREKVKFKIERERRAVVSLDRSIDSSIGRIVKIVMDVRSTFVAFQDHKSNEWQKNLRLIDRIANNIVKWITASNQSSRSKSIFA